MSYKSLYKQFMINDLNSFNKIYQDRFNSNSTIKFNIKINNYQTFFNYDNKIMILIAKIREQNYLLEELLFTLPNIGIEQFQRKTLICEIENSNKIEGIISTRKEIFDLINEIEKKLKTKNRFEGIINKYMLLTSDKINLFDSFDIRRLYDEMLLKEIQEEDIQNVPDGKIFRKNEVFVLNSNSKIIHSGIMPEEKIIEDMDYCLNILNDSNIDILIRIAIFHFFFGYIHPFYDGNGRMNRFISSYLLSKYFNKLIGYKLSTTIQNHLKTYLDSFIQTNDIRNRSDLSTFVYSFLYFVYDSYISIEKDLLEKDKIYQESYNLLQEICLFDHEINNNQTIYQILVILLNVSIFGDFGITKSSLCQKLNKGNTKITEYLCLLKDKGLCEEIRSGKHYYYKANLEKIKSIVK